ncbi:S24 family peptidase [uncultured Solobacterium sp.]|uniref:helix-turn-helix domain-containing protein n=1 Tax=uncultured Solobacterium sp. TaxID=747375 RepID=UPI0028EEDD06|nr:S24 family peptidase [uncultured Solobacterium sp.]
MNIFERIKKLRIEKGLSQEDLAKKVGYTHRSSIGKVETGLVDLSQSKIKAFAKALDVTPQYLMGWEDDNYEDPIILERDNDLDNISDFLFENGYRLSCENYDDDYFLIKKDGETVNSFFVGDLLSTYKNAIKNHTLSINTFIKNTIDKLIRKIALYELISCGTGGFVDDNIIDYVSLPAEMFSSKKEYFAQYAKGDSMINANINNGDLVIFEKTSSVTNGMIGCFCVDDNIATCKRLSMTNGQIILLPENPSYNPIIANVETFKCIGKLAFVINDRRAEEDK